MEIHYITDEKINRETEEDYSKRVIKLKKEIKENGLQKENEEKLLKLVDYIFNLPDKFSYVNESHYTDKTLWDSVQALTVYPDMMHDVIMITGFKEDGLSFFDSTITFKSVIDAMSTVIARSIVIKEEMDENGDIVPIAYKTEWCKSHYHTQLLLDNFTFIYIILETISTHKRELQQILTKSKYHITYSKLSEEYLSDSDKAKTIYTGLDEYLKKHQKIQTIQAIIPKESPKEEQSELSSDNLKESLYDKYNFTTPVNTILDNTKVSRMIFTKEIQDAFRTEEWKDGIPVPVSPKTAKKDSYVILAIDQSKVKTSEYLTGEHKAVLNAVNSIIEAGNDKFTLSSLYEQIYQKTPKQPYQLETLEKTLNVLRQTIITIDYTQHMKMNGSQLDKFTVESNALSLDKATVVINGTERTVYKLNRLPPTYQYAKDCKQIITIENKYLETRSISLTKQAFMIKQYLIERIAESKGSKNMKNTILYENIYSVYSEASNMDMSELSKEKKKNARELTKKILHDFTINEFITGYKENKKRVNGKDTFYSVTFTF